MPSRSNRSLNSRHVGGSSARALQIWHRPPPSKKAVSTLSATLPGSSFAVAGENRSMTSPSTSDGLTSSSRTAPCAVHAREYPCCWRTRNWSSAVRSCRAWSGDTSIMRSSALSSTASTTSVTRSLRTTSPDTGERVSPMRAYNIRKWSSTSVRVPTVLRGPPEALRCSIATAGERPSMRSTSGFSKRPKNWRA